MKFEKPHRREPVEPQLATMIDVFSILIIFLIAGTAMDSSILNIPTDFLLPDTVSESVSINAPQITVRNEGVELNFLNEKISFIEIENENSEKRKYIGDKVKNYLIEIQNTKEKKVTDAKMLSSINLVADKNASYKQIFVTMKFFRNLGFQNTILVGTTNK